MTAGLLAAQPGGWIGAPSGAAVPDAWPPSGDAAFAGLLPGYAFAQVQDTPPTFVSSILNDTSGALAITFSEDIDVTPPTNVVPTKIHIRESGNYTGGGITLSAAELATAADGATISFALNASRLATVAALGTPELTIEPGAVRDTSGTLIDGTFDASTAVHVRTTSVAFNSTTPKDVAFSNDGTRMFVLEDGHPTDAIYEYALSTPFDASTLSFVGETSVSNLEDSPTGMAFSNDGSKMFVIGSAGDDVNEYTLSTAFDTSTLRFVNSTSVSDQESAPTGMAFSNDGSKMFVIGGFGDDVNEYTLSTAFDASTLSFVDATSVSDQENSPQGIAFSNDGFKMFVIGATEDDVNEYALTTPFDASTLRFVDATSVSDQEDNPQGIAFSNDGAKMFVTGTVNNGIYEYALSSVYPITVVSDPFLTTWETVSANQTIGIPVEAYSGETIIDWGDGNTTTVSTNGTQSHTYATADSYQVAMTGKLLRIDLGGSGSTPELLHSIDQWGDIKWSTMNGAFLGATEMTYNATDAPDLSQVTDMSSMFESATAFNGDISTWNTSSVTNMISMFDSASKFNRDISAWDTSSVTDMTRMFTSATAFNGDISTWNTSSVTDMTRMFTSASAFDGDISDWDTSSVRSMTRMFTFATEFNGNISAWDTSSVTNMISMFDSASKFNRDISAWDTSLVTDMSSMFYAAAAFRIDISTWNTSSVTSMTSMFESADTFNGDISTWNTSSVTDMRYMFYDAAAFNGDISAWNVSSVMDMDDMFVNANAFDQNLGPWYIVLDDTTIDLASGTAIGTISPQNSWLANSQSGEYGIAETHDHEFFEVDGTSLNVKDGADYTGKTDYVVNITSTHPFGANNHRLVDVTVTDTSTAFKTTWNTATPNEDITIPATGSYDIDWGDGTAESVTGPKTHTYADAGSHAVTVSGGLTRINLGADPDNAAKLASIDQWGDMEWTTMEGAFHGASNMAYDAADTPDLSGVASMNSMFRDTSFSANLSGWNVSSVTDTGRVFQGSSFNGDISGWDVSRVQGMRSMFSGASSFNQPLDTWNVSSATNMAFMFYDAYRFNQDLGSWTVSSVDTMEYMFGSSAVHSAFNGNISTWDVSQVTNMEGMFGRASSFNGDLSGWDVSSVTDMESMFLIASSFDQPLNDWNVSRVQSMRSMFSEASSFDQPLNDWNVSSVTDMEGMFRNAASFNQPLGTWNVSLVANMDSMFSQANDFDQNLGEWYVVLNSTSINAADAPGVVGGISAQNRYLNGQTPTYAIGTGGDSGSFNITGGSDLNMNITSPAKSPYVVNITSAGGFGDNNHRVLNVTVVGTDSNAAPVLDDIADQEVEELQPLAFTATASDDDAGDILVFSLAGTVPVGASIDPDTGAFSWIPGADQSGTHVITVRVSDGEAADSEDVTVTVTDSATAFVTTWKADTSPDTVSIPVRVHSGGTVTIHWGDGSNSTVSDNGAQTHAYQDSGRYQVAMTGDLSRIIVGGSGSTPDQLLSIDQWGNGMWGSMQNAFKGAMNMEYKATDTPDLSDVTSMDDMFRNTFFTGNLSGWDVSNVETMRGMFYDANHFDGNLSGWNVSAVTDMHSMFRGAHNFNQPLSSWDTSGVTDMRFMFHGARSFNGDISPWDTSGAETMRQMFHGAVSFNGTISGWDVSGVTNMRDMFNGAGDFNQDISGWNVSNVANMADMFNGATAFRQNLGNWYIVLNNTEIDAADAPGVVGTISAQNPFLRDQNATYAIESGRNEFEIVNGTVLNMTVTPTEPLYAVTINSTGGFGDNNHRAYNVTVTYRDTNSPPDVGAGDDQEVVEGDTVTLSGTATDVDTGDDLTYSWTHDSDLAITITGSDSASASFTAPNVAANTTVTVTLTVNDGTVEVSDALQVTITDSPNSPPTVNAGQDQEVVEGATVSLSGTVSDDDPEDDLTYSWTHDSALAITITGSGSVSASFTAPIVAANTTFTVTLAVSDGTVEVSDALQVTVTDSPGLNLTAADGITDAGTLKLLGARGIATFTSGGSTYAAVAAYDDNGVQILDVTDPSAITAAGSINDTGTLELEGAYGIATFTSGGSTYAAVASFNDDGVQILDITDPSDITAADNIGDTGTLELDGAWGIATFESGGSTYAAVAAYDDNGVQILNITDPSDITAADNIGDTGTLELDGAYGIATFTSGGSTYAAVASTIDDGVQILNVTDPYNVTATDSIGGAGTPELEGAYGIATFTSGGSTYAAVAAYFYDGVQILNVTDPSDITAAGSITDTGTLELDGARGIATFTSGGGTYVAVAADLDDGVQILNVTDPYSVTATDNIGNAGTLELNGAHGIATFESGGSTYAAVAAYDDNGVQILRLTGPPPAANSPPTVEAGPDQTVDEGDTVTLSGTASDSDSDPLTYMWTHGSALSISFADDTALSTTFTAPAVTQDTTIIFTLTVSDDTDSVTDTVSVTITNNTPPTVEAGPDQTVDEGDTVTLSGTASDSDSDPLTYMWTHGSALSISFADDTALSTTFTAPAVTQDTTIIFTLTVSDDTDSVTDTVSVTITNNTPPTVEAGADQEVVEGATVTLSGTATDGDPEDDLTYEWTHDGALAITFANPAALSTTFAAPDVAANTTVTVTLTVNDGTVDVSDALQVTITDSPNRPPVVGAGADQEVVEGATVTLSGTATDGDPEDDLTYEWTHDGALAITFANPAALSTTFAAPDVAANTTVTVTLTVNDGTVDVSDALQVTITDSPNRPPVVGAGADQEVVEGATVTLSGTATDGDPEDDLTYEWTHDGALAITFANPAALSTTFAAPDVAANTTVTVTLTVNDGTVDVSDALQVTITDSSNSPPTVNAGQDQEVVEGTTVSLSGTATDGDPEDDLTYEWTHDGALAITFANPAALSTTFAAPDVAANTTVTVTLTVNDGTVDVSDALQVTITDSSNSPPTVNAGQDQEVVEGTTVSLSGTATDGDPEDDLTYEWTHDGTLAITITGSDSLSASFTAPDVDSDTVVQFTLTASDGIASVSDSMLVTITPLESEPEPRDNNDPVTDDLDTNRSPAVATDDSDVVRQDRGGDSSRQSLRYLPAIDLSSIIHSGIVPIPSDILQTAIAFDPSVTIRPSYDWLGLDPPVIINDHGYLLAGSVNTLEPQVIMEGESASIVFTVYDFFDIESLAVYLAPHGSDTRISDNATWFLYNGGVPITADPWNLIADVDVRIEDDAYRQTKKKVNLDVEFENAVGTIDMEIRIWTVDSRSTTVQVLNAMEILADPDRVVLEPPSGQEPPVSPAAALRMWAGLGPVTIGDAGLLAALGLDYPDAVIPTWVKTGLAPLAINNGIAVDEFTTALEYVLGAIRDGGTRDAAGSQPADPDAAAPTVTSIERSDPAEESTSETTLVFGVTFSEGVTGVDAGDFALSPDSGSGPGQFTYTRTPGLAIPDNAAAVSDAITVPGPGTATSVSVSVDIEHPFIDDLTVELVAPDGTARTLHDRSGGNADGIFQTYTPDFAGTGIAGDWTLRASDGAPGDAGTLNGWTLTVNHGGADSPVTGLAGSGSQYLVTVSAPREGTYNLDVIRDSGIADAAGNPLAGAAPTGADHTYTVIADATAPTVASIERSDPAGETTSAQALVFAVTFSEGVTGVDAGDFALSPDSGGGPGQFTQASTPALAIPDNAPAVSDTITVPHTGTATSVSVAVDITHTYIDDLTVDLIAPDGTARTLHDRSGGNADGIFQTYTPDFGGTGIAGDWTLRVSDRAGGDVGTLNGWTLTVNHGSAGNPVTGLIGSGSQYLVTVSATQDGTYNLDLVSSGHGIADAADNPLSSPTQTGADHTYTVIADATAPTVASIERSDPAGETTSAQTLVFAVTFSGDVTGVDAGDFELSPDSTGGGSAPGRFAQTSTPALAIPDNAPAVSDTITVPHTGTATSVSVAVDITHTYIDDLTVEIVAPDGTARTLHRYSGEGTDDIVRMYAPDFGGTGIAGDWTLRVGDRAPGDAGTLNGWTLTVNHGGADSPVTGLAGSGSQYLVTVSAPREGTYNLDVIRDSGIADAAGNPLADAAPTGVDHTYTRTGP